MMPEQQDDHNWYEYRRLVVEHMTSTNGKLDNISTRLTLIESQITELKVKSGAWGAIAGIVTTVGALLLAKLSGIM